MRQPYDFETGPEGPELEGYFDLRATHVRSLLPAALASVSFGFVLVRVRVLLTSIGWSRRRIRTEDYVEAPSFAGGKSSLEQLPSYL